jgi:dipeptide/tripeptide permease
VEGPVEGAIRPEGAGPARARAPAAHFMCGTPFWGIAASAACSYFAYSSYSQIADGNFYWQHGWWIVITWAIWLLLIMGLISETRCWRERIFFGLMLLNFSLGFVLAAWSTASFPTIRVGRQISLVLWVLAALASLRTVTSTGSGPKVPLVKNDDGPQ